MRANGAPATLATEQQATHHLSLTRSAGAKPRPVDAAAQRGGYAVKTHTTSQTLDILRTAVALRDPTDGTRLTDLPLSSFDLFHPAQPEGVGRRGGAVLRSRRRVACVRRGRLAIPPRADGAEQVDTCLPFDGHGSSGDGFLVR